MTELAKSISKLIAVLSVKTGDDGKMFGAVTNGMIADQLKTQFDIALDKKKIHLEKPIKSLGEYEVELRLHPEVHATLKVRIESTTPITAAAVAEAVAAEAKEGQKSESRGHKRTQESADVAPEKEAKDAKPEKKAKAAKDK